MRHYTSLECRLQDGPAKYCAGNMKTIKVAAMRLIEVLLDVFGSAFEVHVT